MCNIIGKAWWVPSVITPGICGMGSCRSTVPVGGGGWADPSRSKTMPSPSKSKQKQAETAQNKAEHVHFDRLFMSFPMIFIIFPLNLLGLT